MLSGSYKHFVDLLICRIPVKNKDIELILTKNTPENVQGLVVGWLYFVLLLITNFICTRTDYSV